MKPLRRDAFTIVELLAVVTVLGTLLAVLLPLLVNNRDVFRRTDCANRQRQIALAALAYQVDFGSFPGYWMPTSTSPKATNTAGCTWPIMLSKYLGHQDFWNAWLGSNGTFSSPPYWDQMVCPNNPPATNYGPWLSYVVNCGLFGNNTNPADGVCFDQLANPPGPKVSTDALQAGQGDSYTLFASENTLGIVSSNSAGWMQTTSAGALQYTGFCWQAVTKPNVPQQINGDKSNPNPPMPGTVLTDYALPASNHPGGVNVVFCDGHYHFLREDVAYSVYQLLMTPDPPKADFPAGSPAIGHTMVDDDF